MISKRYAAGLTVALCIIGILGLELDRRWGGPPGWFAAVASAMVGASVALMFNWVLESPQQEALRATIRDLVGSEWKCDSEDLRRLSRTFHHYHLTQDAEKRLVWYYKVLEFRIGPKHDRLVAENVPIPRDGEHGSQPQDLYLFEAFLEGPHLIIRVRGNGGQRIELSKCTQGLQARTTSPCFVE